MPLDPMAFGAALLFVGAVVASLGAVKAFVARETVVARRLKAGTASADDASPALVERIAESLAPIARAALPEGEEQRSLLRLQLRRAGFRSANVFELFLAGKVGLALAAALLFLWVNATLPHPVDRAPFLAAALFVAGYYLPGLWLGARVRNRQTLLRRGLADTLDLLVTCVEAGLGLDSALQRVAGETRLAWPVLGEELELAFLEIKAGIPRVDAFRRLADRTGLAELKSLAATLTQTQLFGTSVGLALRIQAEGIRTQRMQRAEERAGYVSVKMALPLTLCILPTLFSIVVGPAAIRIFGSLFPLLSGHR